jgi:hypothetical protein
MDEETMTSLRQIEANRRNAGKSTGPTTEGGKQRSRFNAMRHGLTAETVIATLENAEDYKAFEEAVAADYIAETAVERELVLRLAGLLWRLRRSTGIETGLFEIHASLVQAHERDRRPRQRPPFEGAVQFGDLADLASERGSEAVNKELAARFLGLAYLDNELLSV